METHLIAASAIIVGTLALFTALYYSLKDPT